MLLAEFEDGLSSRHVVAAMAVEEDQTPETVLQEVLGQTLEQIEIGSGCGGERAREIEVMVRIAEPHQRREQYAVARRELGAPHDLAEQQAIGEERQMVAVLFQGRDGDDHRGVLGKCRDRGPS